VVPEHLRRFTETPIKVLNDGHVLLVDVMGDDQAIVDAARVSYGAGTKQVSRDRTLIRYLLRHQHTSPFEMCELKLRVRVPMDCWRQWIRHRMASVNEYSTRYSEAIDSCQVTLPGEWRLQAMDNKQGSAGFLTEWPTAYVPDPRSIPKTPPGEYLCRQEEDLQQHVRRIYEERIKFGVAREQARKDLTLSTFTEAYWKIDLKNLMNFLSLRMDHHAQKEIRDFANAIAEIVAVWVPMTWEAFQDYDQRRNGMLLSRMELEGLRAVLRLSSDTPETDDIITDTAIQGSGLEGLEAKEFTAKLKRILRGLEPALSG